MGRFDRILTPRLQVEVSLPNYDVHRSIVAAAKRRDRQRRKNRERNALVEGQKVPDAEPVQLGSEPQEPAASERQLVEIQL